MVIMLTKFCEIILHSFSTDQSSPLTLAAPLKPNVSYIGEISAHFAEKSFLYLTEFLVYDS